MRYEQVYSNEWVQTGNYGYKVSCCDCGLVHELDFRFREGELQIRYRTNKRSTAMMRRWNFKEYLKALEKILG